MLGPRPTWRRPSIEELIVQLSSHITIALVTHNLFQATRISDRTAVFLLDDEDVGTLVEAGPTLDVFRPQGPPDGGLRHRPHRLSPHAA